MDLLAELAGMQKNPGKPCVVARLRLENPEMAEHFDRAVASQYDATTISRWFAKRKITVSDQAVRRHRNGLCATCQTS